MAAGGEARQAPASTTAATLPVYYSDLVVRKGWMSLSQLRGSRLAYNDVTSLSGYECLRMWLVRQCMGESQPGKERYQPMFGSAIQTGGHHGSLLAVLDGHADCAAIDRNVLVKLLRDRAGSALAERVRNELEPVQSVRLGPNPSQPVCVCPNMEPRLRDALLCGFLSIDAALLEPFQIEGFHRVEPADYESIRRHLADFRGVHLLTAPGDGGREEQQEGHS